MKFSVVTVTCPYNLSKVILREIVEGECRRGGQRKYRNDNINERTGCTTSTLVLVAENRER